MTYRFSRDDATASQRVAAFGADLRPMAWEQVSLARLSGDPLSFPARQIARHWNRLYTREAVTISLWQRKKAGYAVSFTTCVAGRLLIQSSIVDSVGDAICLLEDYCARLPEPAPMPEYLMESILQLQRIVEFSDVFQALAGEALADWMDPENSCRQPLLQHKAPA